MQKNKIERHWGSKINLTEESLPTLKFQYIHSHIQDNNIKILEIGCGDGKYLNTIKEINPSAKLYGCDIKPMSYKPKFDFKLIKENEKLPYNDKTFDVVIVLDVLEHVKDYKFMIKEVKRVMKTSAWFCGFVPIEGEPLSDYSFYRLLFGKNLYEITKGHVKPLRREVMLSTFRNNFNGGEFHYSYHLLGQFMDATLFAMLLYKPLEKKFWNENKYYNENNKGLFNNLLTLANKIAYNESLLMQNRKLFSAGLHFSLRNFEYAPECYDDIPGYPFYTYNEDRWIND